MLSILSNFLTMAAAAIGSPFFVRLLWEYMNGGPAWVPHLIVLVVGLALYAFPVFRTVSLGLLLGTLLYGVILIGYDGYIPFIPRDVPPPF